MNEEQAAALMQLIAGLPADHYAVVDGARFDDLPGTLTELGLAPRPLYLEGADPQAVANGPYLMPLSDMRQASAVLRMIAGQPAAVFWSWPGGMDGLYRHLRGLNAVQVARTARPVGPEDYETLLFRHYDPNVLGLMIEVMDEGQRRTLLGSSPAIAFFAPKLGAPRLIRGPHAALQ